MKRLKFFLVWSFALITISSGVLFCGAFWLKSYLQSPEFEVQLEELASQKLHGEVSFDEVKPQDLGLACNQVELKNHPVLSVFSIKGFETTFKKWSFLKRSWLMHQLECDAVQVNIVRVREEEDQGEPVAKPQKSEPVPKKMASKEIVSPKKPSSIEQGVESLKESGLTRLQAWLPNTIGFDSVVFHSLSGSVELDDSELIWNGFRFDGKVTNNILTGDFTNGELILPIPVLSHWNLRSGQVSIGPKHFNVGEAELSAKDGGVLRLKGDGALTGETLSFQGTITELPVQSLVVKPKYEELLRGDLSGEFQIGVTDGDVVVSGDIKVDEGELRLPSALQKALALALPDINESSFKLDRLSSKFRYSEDRVELSNLILEAGSLFALQAEVVLEEATYDLKGQFGISKSLKEMLPNALSQQFTLRGNRYWLPVQLAGKKDSFADDIKSNVTTALVSASLGVVGGDFLQNLSEKANQLIEDQKGSDSVEKAERYLKGGIKSLKSLFR